jgi:hypothetical protein
LRAALEKLDQLEKPVRARKILDSPAAPDLESNRIANHIAIGMAKSRTDSDKSWASVPELTRSSDIKLNKRVQLSMHAKTVAS